MNADYKGKSKDEQNKIYKSNLKVWLVSMKKKEEIIAREVK